MRALLLSLLAVSSAYAQFTILESHSTASLRGVHHAGGGVVWASGTNGAVLRSVNDGRLWQTCAVPEGAAKLDFRGIQAFDANVAIVMSSGAGGLSRLYKTKDGCRTWQLLLTNPDETGFWDALQFSGPSFGVLVGDPVDHRFPVWVSTDAGDTWRKISALALAAAPQQSLFAASNTSLLLDSNHSRFYLLTGGGTTSLIAVDLDRLQASSTQLDLATGDTAGGFSLTSRMNGSKRIVVAMGGDYHAPDRSTGTAAAYIDDPRSDAQWHAANTPPHGYRSAVAYSAAAQAWIAVGPNGADLSTDDGRNWRALKPSAGETRDADRNWNALSLPFAVGPNGRIGKLTLP